MKLNIILLSSLLGTLMPLTAQETPQEPQQENPGQKITAPTLKPWEEEFNALSEETRKTYINKFVMAEGLFQQKRIIECLRVTDELSKLYNGNPGLFNMKGACYMEIHDVKNSLENFKKAFEIDPANTTFEVNIAECYFINHDYAIAAEKFKALIGKLPENIHPFLKSLLQFKLYICYVKLDKTEEAAKLAGLYNELDDVPYYYSVKAVQQFVKNDKEAGTRALASAAAIFQDSPMFQPYLDAMQESGIVESHQGQTAPEKSN